MARTAKEIYPTIEKYVSKDALTWILKDCLSRGDLETIANQCRIDYLGASVLSKTTDILSRDVAQEFFKNPKARELIAFYLNNATQKETQIISQISISDILIKLREPQSKLIETGQVGKYLWSILIDERPEAVNIIPIFILKVLETIRRFSNILQELKKQETAKPRSVKPILPPVPREVSKLEEELNKAKKELSISEDNSEKLQSKNTQLEERIQNLQEQYKSALTEVQSLKHEKNIFTKKIKDLEQSIEEIKKRHQNIEDLQSKIHQIERDNKMLRYEQDKKNIEISILPKIREENEKNIKIVSQFEKKVKDLENIIEEKEEEVNRFKEAFKREALVKKETKKTLKSAIPRVGIFVDVQNIYYGSKEKYEAKLDFQKLLHETLQGRRLVKAIAYVVKTPEINQGNFISTLESLGYEIKAKNLKIRLDGSAKGDWDLGIAIDTISFADKLDVVVLVSGDGDFVDLVRMLRSKNIRVEVASFPHNTSGDLIDAVDFHFTLDEKILL